MQPPPKQTTHLVQIEQAARDVTTGQIGINEFGALVTRFENLFVQKLAEVGEIDIPDDFLAEIADELAVGRRGIELYIEAMGDFREYLRCRRLEPIHRGVEKARAANDLVNQALEKNWATYFTYRQVAEEYLRQVRNEV